MSQIAKETIERILAATDVVELVSSYLPLKRAGSSWRANCPFHHEKTPSFFVNPARQSFHCFGCGKGGDAITFVRDYENLPFADAVRKLGQRAGIAVVEEVEDPAADRARRLRGRLLDIHREATAFFHQRLVEDPAAAHARDYLKARGFGRTMAEAWQVGWMPGDGAVFLTWAREKGYSGRELVASGLAALRDDQRPAAGLYVRFRDRLMFPVRNEIGDAIAFSGRQLREDPNSGKYVNSPETALFRKSSVLFALDRAKKPILREKSALLCEGQMDVIACHEHGIDHALAPLGTAFTPGHARLLRRYTKDVLVCYDGDRAGVAGAERAFRELVAEGLAVRVVLLPPKDDPDSFLKREGPEAFRALLAEGREFFEHKLARASAEGALDSAEERGRLTNECAELLAAMADPVALDQQVNLVATLLRGSPAALRSAVDRQRKRRRPRDGEPRESAADGEAPAAPAPLDRTVGHLCQLALASAEVQHFLGEQFETLHEARRWLPGVGLLEAVLAAAPDPASSAAVNSFLSTLPEPERLAMADVMSRAGPPLDHPLAAAEQALAALSAIILQRRDAAVKAELRQPGLAPARMVELLEEAKEIRGLLGGYGQRFEHDDELAAAPVRRRGSPSNGAFRTKNGR